MSSGFDRINSRLEVDGKLVVFWNPTVPLPTWTSFYSPLPVKLSLWKLGAIVLATTAAIWGIRSQGYLEPIELATYDLEMNSRAPEPPDEWILVIGIERNTPISDRVLLQVAVLGTSFGSYRSTHARDNLRGF